MEELGVASLICVGLTLFGNVLSLSAQTTINAVEKTKVALESSTVSAVEDLVGHLRDGQDMFLMIMPPGGGFTLKQTGGMVVFDPKVFPDTFTSGLIGEQIYDCPVYAITLAEDPATHETMMFNADGKEIASVKPEAGYNPWWYLDMKYPDLYSGLYSEDEIKRLQDEYDPSHIQITLTLLPADYVKTYAAAVAAEKAKLAAEQAAFELNNPKSKLSGGMLRMYQGTGMTNLEIVAFDVVTNGMKVTLAYPDNYTNRVDFFTCPDLLAGWWDLAVSATNVSTSTNWIAWTDTAASSQPLRFYAAGNADLDSDSDGLADAREKFMYHTCPTNADTDGDGLSDSNEVFCLNTDPNNPKTNKPNVWISYPASESRKVWLP